VEPRLTVSRWAALAAALVVVILPILRATPARSEPVCEIHEVAAAVDPTWTIHWQAKTSERGGQFRLYSGTDLDNLRIVDIQQAVAGFGGYRFRHASSGGSQSVYQLRYVTSAGRELVLANLRVHRVGLQQAPGSIGELPGPAAKALSETGVLLALICDPQELPTDVRLAEAQRPEPEVPPPRGHQKRVSPRSAA